MMRGVGSLSLQLLPQEKTQRKNRRMMTAVKEKTKRARIVTRKRKEMTAKNKRMTVRMIARARARTTARKRTRRRRWRIR